MHSFLYRISRVTLIASTLGLAACATDRPPPFRTVPGPETPQILAPLQGRLAVAQGDQVCVQVASIARPRATTCIPEPRRAFTWRSAVLPAGAGSLLVLQTGSGDTPDTWSVALVRTHCSGDRDACRPQRNTLASWSIPKGGNLYHKPLAISPDGRWAATIPASRLLKLEGYSPRLVGGQRFRDLRTIGEIVLIDLRSGQQRATGIEALDEQPLSWSGDGARLLFVRAETAAALPTWLAAQVEGNEGRGGQGVPIVETLDLSSGTIAMLAIGLDPLWSDDASQLLFKVADDRLELRELDTGRRRGIVLPGMTGRFGPIAFVGPHRLLYWALPTDGTEPGSTVDNSPLVGPKQMVALKVVDLETMAFATVDPSLDPRALVGYSRLE